MRPDSARVFHSVWGRKLLTLVAALAVGILIGEGALRTWERLVVNRPRGISADTVDLAALNYNDSTVRRRRADGEFRVLSFGDSFGYTVVKYPYSYHGVAAEILQRSGAAGIQRDVRIINLGEPAVSFYQYMEGYRYWGSLIEHDAVVFNVYLGNDFADVAYNFVRDDAELNRLFGPLDVNLQTGQRRAFNVPRKYPLRILDHVLVRYHLWTKNMSDAKETGRGPYNLALAELSEDKYYATLLSQMDTFDSRRQDKLTRGFFALTQFLRFVSEIRSQGTKVLIMLAPNETQVTSDLRRDLVERYGLDLEDFDFELPAYLVHESARHLDEEIPILDLYAVLSCADGYGQDLYYGRDTHWSVEGNRIAGESLARAIAFSWFGNQSPLEAELDDCVQRQPPLGGTPAASPDRQAAFRGHVEPLLSLGSWDDAVASRAPSLPALAEMEPAQGSSLLAIDKINSVEFDSVVRGTPIVVSGDLPVFTVTGWTVDEAAATVAGGLYLVIDNEYEYAANYGLGRPDVAAFFNNSEYRHSGFEVRVPVAEVGGGEHELSFRILTHDQTAYYDPRIRVRIRIE